ncbi:MAG: tRNA (N6-isopentenyl adenosine(37)-C2)-methylthiotransferase MiaB [Thermoanaerobaculia bacterium]|nr:tRNA (N6-isopentenyl adenosine(37)-C2)-methylthiotransferase MiaB [Thermoanaerobaculia bacterium]
MRGRFFVETWGCQMNELDSQRMAGQLIRQGLVPADDPGEADIILLNSCSVREKAEHKVYSRLGEYRRFKRERPGVVLGLCGCVAQEAGERALGRVPHLDFVLGPSRVGELSDVLARRAAGERPVLTGFPDEIRYELDAISRDGSHKGMITIVEGCDKKCTFCIVPLTRGPERSRPLASIVEETRRLVGEGFVEIELLGQTVNHWREPGGTKDFADLLDAVCAVDGVRRLRFVTSYPRDFTPRMVERFARHETICPSLHLPVQSGSDRVLKLMGRGYTAGEYRQLVGSLRRARPDLALATDLIVGFPGETEEDFRATLDLVEETRFASVFAFRYSPRPGTAAPRLPDPVPDAVAAERLQRLLARQQEIQRELNEALTGRVLETLITGPGRRPEMLTGRTPCHRIVHFARPQTGEAARVGALVPVRVERALPHSLLGSAAA